MTIVNCTYIGLKGLKLLTAHIRGVDIDNKYVTEL